MTEEQVKRIADEADMVVNGYAFTKCENGFLRAFSLHEPFHASLFSSDGSVLETSMDDIEIAIAQGYLERNREFMEA